MASVMETNSFDPCDKDSWYFGPMSRQDATDLLMAEREGGVFLVRDSTTILGDFVLCVREDSKVSHYIINNMQQGDQTRFRIGDQTFTDLPGLLAFYKIHYLDTTPLIRPAPKRVEKVIARYDFNGNDPDDLPFRKGDILTIVMKDEEQWWTAMNSHGQKGSIPVPYVHKYDEHMMSTGEPDRPSSQNTGVSPSQHQQYPLDRTNSIGIRSLGSSNDFSMSISSLASSQPPPYTPQVLPQSNVASSRPPPYTPHRILPAYAKVKQARVPNAYDKTALKLQIGDVVKVTKTNLNGQWEGELNGKTGHFPFTHVAFIDSDNPTEVDDS